MPSWCMLELAKTVKQKQSSQKQVAEGSQVAFLAARLGEVFIDYAELTDCPLMGTTPGINPWTQEDQSLTHNST